MAVPEKTIPKMHCKCLIALVNKSQCVIFVYLFFKSVFWILHCLALCFSTWNVIKFTHNVLADLLHCLHESCIGCLILSQHCRHIGSGKTALLTHTSDFSGYKAQYITFLNWFQRFMINLYYKTFFLYYLLFTFFVRNCYAFFFYSPKPILYTLSSCRVFIMGPACCLLFAINHNTFWNSPCNSNDKKMICVILMPGKVFEVPYATPPPRFSSLIMKAARNTMFPRIGVSGWDSTGKHCPNVILSSGWHG